MTTTSFASPSTQTTTGDWEIDPAHTTLGFAARHAMVTTVRGRFQAFSGQLHLDADDPSRSTAEVTIDASSIATGNEQRDAHLRTNDFLDVPTYPTITFRSTRAAAGADPETYTMWGELTIRGVSKEVQLDLVHEGTAVDPFGNVRAGFTGSTTINRKDWGVSWNAALEAGGFLVSDKVQITLDVSAIKQSG
ncbi:MAG: YceI family protein [Mycobacteriales bacterium]|nr:YceI family protein [Frankia sp.]